MRKPTRIVGAALAITAALSAGGCVDVDTSAYPLGLTGHTADFAEVFVPSYDATGKHTLTMEPSGVRCVWAVIYTSISIDCGDNRRGTAQHRSTESGLWTGSGLFLNGTSFTIVNGKSALVEARLAEFRAAQAARRAPPATVATTPAAAPTAAGPTNLSTEPLPLAFAKGPDRPDDIAVIIGNADYGRQGKDIPNVKPAYADAAGMRRYAIEALGIREGNIIALRDATGAQMERVFGDERSHRGQLFDWVKPGRTRVFVYYAGHGAPGGADGRAYLVPADADGNRIEINGFPLDVLYANLAKLPAASVTVVIEACFSGASPAGAVVANASPVFLKPKMAAVPSDLTVVTAGGPNQMASWEQDGSQSLFTKHFLKGMSGEADTQPFGNGDGRVEWNELDRYLKETVTYLARRFYGRDQVVQIRPGRGN